jgi:large subunit ribosomal protein L5
MADNESKKPEQPQAEGSGEEQPVKAEKAPKPAKTEKKAAAGDKGKPEKGKGEKGKPDKGKEKGKEKETAKIKRTAPPRLKVLYQKEIVPRLVEEFKYRNPNQVPRLVKITINMGLGEAITNPKLLDSSVEELRVITGQQPVVTRAKKSIATYKLRQGMKIGCMVTLRRERMYEFFDRLVSLALPRVRDFKGISPKSFDGRGNFSVGIREQIIFPEINYDKIDKIKGLNISIVTTARTDDEGRALLKHLGMPFRQQS